MLAFSADATHDKSLREAGILRAKGLIAALASDASNHQLWLIYLGYGVIGGIGWASATSRQSPR
jgi:Trk K+ transport system NAD-binding subunit